MRKFYQKNKGKGTTQTIACHFDCDTFSIQCLRRDMDEVMDMEGTKRMNGICHQEIKNTKGA